MNIKELKTKLNSIVNKELNHQEAEDDLWEMYGLIKEFRNDFNKYCREHNLK